MKIQEMTEGGHRIRTAELTWDEDDGSVYLAVPGAATPDVKVWWTPEGALEVLSVTGRVKLLVQLKDCVKSCSWGAREGSPNAQQQLVVRLEKRHRGTWGSALLGGDVAVSLPSAAAREQGLSKASAKSGSGALPATRRIPWRRLRERVLLPLGYARKLLHVTDGLDGVMWVLMVALVLLAPYTKVEESFGMQAAHDFLNLGSNLDAYDHRDFPGVVARTFLGPLVLAILAAPGTLLVGLKVGAQYLVRIAMGTVVVLCMKLFRLELRNRFGPPLATAFGVVCCTQFHLLFYMSRTLPNVPALALVLLAVKFWMQERFTRCFFIFILTAVVFRAEVAILFGAVVLDALVRRRVRFWWVLWCGVVFGLIALLVSIALDSIMWRRLVWPEGSGLLFNVMENKSHLYGVSPWHWYATSALPRALLGSFVMMLIGFVTQPRVRRYAMLGAVFVAAFSFLPHKELRFVMYAIPLLNLAAAAVLESVWRSRNKLGIAAVVLLLAASVGGSSVMAAASLNNYPGGEAIRQLHQARGSSSLPGTSVWMSNLACQTGVTRFLQVRPEWLYSKSPEVEQRQEYGDFTFVIAENEAIPGFREIGSVQAFAGIRKWPPAILIKTALRIFENET